jgi:hypothetical protein
VSGSAPEKTRTPRTSAGATIPVARGSLPIFARLIAAGIAATLSLAAPALAVTPKEKQATCEFGANDQKLTGAKRKAFITRCMASEDRPAKAKKSKPKS